MKCCVTLIVYLVMTSVPRSESLGIISAKRNALQPTTVTPILPDYEKESSPGSTNNNNNVYSSQFDNVQPHVNDLDSDLNLFTTPATHDVTSKRLQRPSFPTFTPPPGAIYPGMPTTTATTNSYGYSNQLRPDDSNKVASVDSAPGQGTSSAIQRPFHNRQPPSPSDNPLEPTQQTGRGDDDALILLDSVSCVPNEEQGMTPGRADNTNRLHLVTSTTSKTPVPVPVDGDRRIIDGPVIICTPGTKSTGNGGCREPASSQFDNVQPHVNDLGSDLNLITTPATHEVTSKRLQRPSFPTFTPPPGAIYPGMPTTTATTNPYGYSNQLRPDDSNKVASVDSAPGQGTSSAIQRPFHNRQPPSPSDNPLEPTQQTGRGDDDALILLDSVSCVPNEEQGMTPGRADNTNRLYLVTPTTSKTPVPVPVDGDRRIIDRPVIICTSGTKSTGNGGCREPARK